MRNLHLLSVSTLALASLALAACGPQQSASSSQTEAVSGLALAPGDSAAAYAPAAAQLPEAAPLRLASAGVERQPYSYLDDAYDLGDAFADSPPDYTVDYQGTRPLIWRSQAGAYRVVEQTSDGERDYYYRAGADQPFLVRDPQHAYAYDGDVLAEVYDSAGRPVAQDIAARDAAVAARYLARARQIYAAAVHDQRQAANAADWQARRNAVLASQRDWAAEQQRNADWRQWHDQQAQNAQAAAALQQERSQRQASAATLAGVAAGAAMQHRQDQAVDQARAQQAQADAARNQDEARRQQQAAAVGQSQDRQRQMQVEAARQSQAQQAQAHAQQAQADGARRDAEAHQQQAQAQAAQAHAQRAQADGARRDAQAHQQQAQAQAAQAHAQQAQAQAAHAQQAHVQQAQAEQARRVQAEAQAHPPAPPISGQGDKHGPHKPDAGKDRDKDHDKPPA